MIPSLIFAKNCSKFKMFVGRRKLITLVNSIVKSKLRLPLEEARCVTIVNTANLHISKAYFSEESSKPGTPQLTRQPEALKTPLTTFITKEIAKPEHAEEEESKRVRESSWRTMKITLMIFGFSITCLGVYLVFELGKPRINEFGNEIEDEFSNMSKFKQYIYRAMEEIIFYIKVFEEPSRDKLLPDLSLVYQPPYTLVLEMTDVLVHPDWTYQTGWRFKKRPGVQRFLESVANDYEIVVYTAEQGMTVFPIIEAIDPNNVISYKLVRDATHFYGGHHVKSLKNLNRDLSKVVVVDWNAKSVKFNPDNLLKLPRWEGQDEDDTLFHLAAMLHTIAESGVEDVRTVCKNFSQFDNPPLEFNKRQKILIDKLELERQEEYDKSPSYHRWFKRRIPPK